MNTFKNFIYNISDILVALLIIAAAVLIIGWRVNTIMDYPDKIAAVQTETKEDNAPKQTDTGSASETSPAEEQTKDDAQISGGADTETASAGKNSAPVTINVMQNDTVSDIAQSLVSAGVISDPQLFIVAVEAAGAATQLKYGTYDIPAKATMDQIIQIMI